MILDFNKQNYSQEKKESLCHSWRNSGLSKSEFCRQNGLKVNTFYGWCAKLWPDEVKKHTKTIKPKIKDNWVNLNPDKNQVTPKSQLQNNRAIEIKLPNGMVIGIPV